MCIRDSIKPEPWTAKTVALRWAQLGIDSTSGNAIEEIQLALDVKRFGIEEANRRAAPDPYDELRVPEGLDLNWITDDVLAAARRGDDSPFSPGKLPPPEIVQPYRSLVGDRLYEMCIRDSRRSKQLEGLKKPLWHLKTSG